MKITAIAVLAFASAVLAQSSNDIPECARDCISNSTKAVTDCAINDYGCACQEDNFKKIQHDSSNCVVYSCGVAPTLRKYFCHASNLFLLVAPWRHTS